MNQEIEVAAPVNRDELKKALADFTKQRKLNAPFDGKSLVAPRVGAVGVWGYDFPQVFCFGTITQLSYELRPGFYMYGCCRMKEYGGAWFKPVFCLEPEDAEVLKKAVARAEAEYDADVARAAKQHRIKLENILSHL